MKLVKETVKHLVVRTKLQAGNIPTTNRGFTYSAPRFTRLCPQ